MRPRKKIILTVGKSTEVVTERKYFISLKDFVEFWNNKSLDEMNIVERSNRWISWEENGLLCIARTMEDTQNEYQINLDEAGIAKVRSIHQS